MDFVKIVEKTDELNELNVFQKPDERIIKILYDWRVFSF